MNKNEKIEKLIANKRFDETDREFLVSLDETRIDKIIAATEAKQEPAPVTNEAKPEIEPEMKTEPAPVVNESDEVKFGKRLYNQHRQTLIANIKKNPNNSFSDESLNAMPFDQLEMVSKLAGGVSYAGNGGGPEVNTPKTSTRVLEVPAFDSASESK